MIVSFALQSTFVCVYRGMQRDESAGRAPNPVDSFAAEGGGGERLHCHRRMQAAARVLQMRPHP